MKTFFLFSISKQAKQHPEYQYIPHNSHIQPSITTALSIKADADRLWLPAGPSRALATHSNQRQQLGSV